MGEGLRLTVGMLFLHSGLYNSIGDRLVLRYKALGITLDSDTSLSGLETCDEGATRTPVVTVRQVPFLHSVDSSKFQLVRRILADARGKCWDLYQGDTSYLLEYDGLVQYNISCDGNHIGYALNRDDLEQFFQWALLHLVLLFALHLRCIPVYHAGGVSVDGKALVVFGHSGQGKSTLSASFGKAGYTVITDDVLVLEETEHGFNALPSFPWVRLCRESIDALFGQSALESLSADDDGKLRVSLDSGLVEFSEEPIPLKGVYVLSNVDTSPSDELIEISPISRAEAVGILLGRDSMLPILGRDQVSYLLTSLTRLVAQVPVWRLRIKPGLDQLPQVVQALVKHESDPTSLSEMSAQGTRG